MTSHLAQPQWSPQNKSPSDLDCTNTNWCFSQRWGCDLIWQALSCFLYTLSWLPPRLAVTCAALPAVLKGPMLLCRWWAWWCWLHAVRVPFCHRMTEKINFLRGLALEKQKGKVKSLKQFLFT